MTDREKLIGLLKSNQEVLNAAGVSATATLRLADHLIANGVTVQDEQETPLTLDELRQMEGEPVYIVYGKWKDWRIPDFIDVGTYKGFIRFTDKSAEPIAEYGKNWLAYRNKPKEVWVNT